MSHKRDLTKDTKIGLADRAMTLRKQIKLDYRAANDGLDIRALRDEGIVDVPDALSDDAESVYELEDESMSKNRSDCRNDNDGDIISDKNMGVESEYHQQQYTQH
jgi:hypothetical protein